MNSKTTANIAFDEGERRLLDRRFADTRELNFHDFPFVPRSDVPSLHDSFKNLGYEIQGGFELFKACGIVEMHTDLGASNDIVEYYGCDPDNEKVANFVYIYDIQRHEPKIEEGSELGWKERNPSLMFLWEGAEHEPERFWKDAQTKIRGWNECRAGDLILFDARYHHGIMTNHKYWLLVGVLRWE
jgi:hypothetical protein